MGSNHRQSDTSAFPESHRAFEAAGGLPTIDLRSLLASRAGRLALLRLGTPAIGLLTDKLITHHVDLAGLGTYAVLTSVAALFSMVASLGIPGPLHRELALAGGRSGRSKLIASSMAATGMMWAVLSLVLLVSGGSLLRFWLSDASFGQTLFVAALTGGLALQALAVAVARGFDRLTIATIADLIVNKLLFIAGLGAIAIGLFTAQLSTVLVLAGIAAFAPIVLVLGWIAWRDEVYPVAPDFDLARTLSLQSWALLGHQIVLTVSSSVALWILSGAVDYESAGLFYLLTRLAALVAVPGIVVQFLFGNRMAEAHDAGDPGRIQHGLSRVVAGSTTVATGLAVMLLVGHRFVLDLLSGRELGWTPTLPLLILVAGQLIQVATGPCGYSLIMAKQETSILKSTAFGAALATVVAALFIGPFGITGAALASSAGVVAINVANLVASRRRVGLNTALAVRGR